MKEHKESKFKSKPDENSVFTTLEIATALEISVITVRNFARKINVNPLRVQAFSDGRKSVWSYEFYRTISDHIKKRHEAIENIQRKKDAEFETKQNANVEELKKNHPLVTDERCFQLSYWPETIPKNLEEE